MVGSNQKGGLQLKSRMMLITVDEHLEIYARVGSPREASNRAVMTSDYFYHITTGRIESHLKYRTRKPTATAKEGAIKRCRWAIDDGIG